MLKARVGQKMLPHVVDWLDREIGGLAAGELVVIGGVSGEGKSSLAVSWASRLMEQDFQCAYFTLEESIESIKIRLAAMMYPLHPRRLAMADLREEDWAHVHAFDNVAATWSLMIRQDVLCAKDADAFLDQHPAHIVFVDHLQQVARHPGTSEYDSMTNEIHAWRALALRRRVAVVLVSQLSKQMFQRETDEPKMSDLKGTGAIAQLADCVVMLWWPDRANRGPHVLKVAKNRRGLCHDGLKLKFDGERRAFPFEVTP